MAFTKGNKHGAKLKNMLWKPAKQKTPLLQILLAEIKQEGLPAPELEHRFHSIRKWRFDLAFVPQKIAVEIHGSVFAGGRHTRGAGFQKDREKMNEAQIGGWVCLEYSTGQVKQGIPILDLKRIFAARVQ